MCGRFFEFFAACRAMDAQILRGILLTGAEHIIDQDHQKFHKKGFFTQLKREGDTYGPGQPENEIHDSK